MMDEPPQGEPSNRGTWICVGILLFLVNYMSVLSGTRSYMRSELWEGNDARAVTKPPIVKSARLEPEK